MPSPSPSRRIVSPYLSLLLVVVTAALLVPSGFVTASGPNGTVQGFITSAGTGLAIPGATVRASASDLPWSFETTTDAGGSFVLSVPNHRYTVAVSAAAYVVNSTAVAVGSGDTVWLNMTLAAAASRSARLQGFVKDGSSSAPVLDGHVVARTTSWAAGNRYQNESALNASGYYEIDLVPGYYDVLMDGLQNYTPFLYSYLTLGSGVQMWYNISLTPLVGWINGTILDANNYSHISGASIAGSFGGLALIPTSSNASGEFSLRVPTGSILLVGDAPGYVPDSSSVYVWGSGTTSVSLYLTPLSAHVRGFVHDGLTGNALAGAQVTATSIWSSGYWDQAVTGASGAYALALNGDDFYVSVSATGYTSGATWAFLSTGDNVWWNVTLWPIVSTLKGYLIDGADGSHLAGKTVYGSDARSGYSVSAVSDASGLFSLMLPPSPAITAYVFGAAPYAGAIGYATTRPYATTWMNLTLPRLNAVLAVSVTDALTGMPIPAASVTVSWYYGSNYGTTNASGAAAIDVLGGATLSLYAGATGYLAWSGSVAAFTGTDSFPIQLYPDLAANVTVKGYVRDAGTNATLSSVVVRATGYGMSAPYDYTDGLGFYTLSIVPRPQTVRATEYGYAAGVAALDPAPGSTVWLNFSLAPDSAAPSILSFAASPAVNLGPSNPATLSATLNESSLDRVALSILQMRSSSAGIGTFLSLGQLDASTVSLTPTTPGNYSVSAPWDTRTRVGRLSDGLASEWWPAPVSYNPYQVTVSGYWDNATLGNSVSGTAAFDSRTGALLYVYAYAIGYISPLDQPDSTFSPSAVGVRIDLTSSAVLGYTIVTGSTYRLGSLTLTLYNPAPGGTYAALLEAFDSGGNYASAATLMSILADTVAPTARAGPDQTVGQGALVTLDGSTSTDNTGVVNYTWTFSDGSSRVLYGSVVTYRFQNPGNYVVTLTARDAAGNHGSDALTITVLDTALPTVSFAAPSEGANVTGMVTLTTTVADNVGVVRVVFYSDGSPLGTATSAPFSLSINTANLANGVHTLTAVAFDAAGNSATATLHLTTYNVGGGAILGLDTTTWLLLIVVIVAAVGSIVVLLLRRRRYAMPPVQPPLTPPTSGP